MLLLPTDSFCVYRVGPYEELGVSSAVCILVICTRYQVIHLSGVPVDISHLCNDGLAVQAVLAYRQRYAFHCGKIARY